MNRIFLMGWLGRDPDIRYGGANNTAVARFSLGVNRSNKKEGDTNADFFNCVSFGKQGEFVEKYLHKGTKVVIEGELQNNNYTNKNGEKVYAVQIITHSIEFAERKAASESKAEGSVPDEDGFMSIPDDLEDDGLPFN